MYVCFFQRWGPGESACALATGPKDWRGARAHVPCEPVDLDDLPSCEREDDSDPAGDGTRRFCRGVRKVEGDNIDDVVDVILFVLWRDAKVGQ